MKFVRFPIIIFSYNRPYHLKKSLEVLCQNNFINYHKVFFINDGPKNSKDKKKIKIIKKIINRYKNLIIFKEIKFNKKNLGLSKNIIFNITKILKRNKAAIILEDDILAKNNSVEFINFYLNKEINSKIIGSVSGYSYLDNFRINKIFHLFLSKRHSSWAWGTWSRVWFNFKLNYLDNNKKKDVFDLNSKGFNSLGNDMKKMLWAQKNGLINSWAILFNYFCFRENYKCLQPRYSLIQNIGLDNSGTHSSFRNFLCRNKSPTLKFKYFKKKYFFSKQIDRIIKDSHSESLKLKIFYNMNNIKKFFINIISTIRN
jgi:hypothetical protein